MPVIRREELPCPMQEGKSPRNPNCSSFSAVTAVRQVRRASGGILIGEVIGAGKPGQQDGEIGLCGFPGTPLPKGILLRLVNVSVACRASVYTKICAKTVASHWSRFILIQPRVA